MAAADGTLVRPGGSGHARGPWWRRDGLGFRGRAPEVACDGAEKVLDNADGDVDEARNDIQQGRDGTSGLVRVSKPGREVGEGGKFQFKACAGEFGMGDAPLPVDLLVAIGVVAIAMDRDKSGERKPVLHRPYGAGCRIGSQFDLRVVTQVAGIDRTECQCRESDEQIAVGEVGPERARGVHHGVGGEESTERKPVLAVDIVEVTSP